MSDEDETGVVRDVPVFILNKRAAYEKVFRESGHDLWKREVDALCQFTEVDKQQILARRKQLEGVGLLKVNRKFYPLLNELIKTYLLGYYHSTIALCGMAIERICYDYIEHSDLIIDGKHLSKEEKEPLLKLNLASMVDFLYKAGKIDDESRKVMMEINDTRNRYVHPMMKGDPATDALKVVNRFCQVAEELLSFFISYDIKDGRVVKKGKSADADDMIF